MIKLIKFTNLVDVITEVTKDGRWDNPFIIQRYQGNQNLSFIPMTIDLEEDIITPLNKDILFDEIPNKLITKSYLEGVEKLKLMRVSQRSNLILPGT